TCYNGWKRKHYLKYHRIVIPDGLISNLFRSIDRTRNNTFLLQESNLPAIRGKGYADSRYTPN
ncbi:hypothetical protein L873DRAFT_1687498, partial [Choiromyces venosus 120613-1]